ncbi:NAD-dependent epimerase/dehydratase family protein [Paenibacillus sp. sgz500958]|uniref:NAD-dependent epimerase/dehydratase family protein n=1 Tax=Paenibacillus sp. sgz500958 TaxID=3242475 RepID=UPI0036D35672
MRKRILITGANSYIGTRFKDWVGQWAGKYRVDELSVRGEAWKEVDFSAYDAVLHVAGIAHVSTDPKLEQLYYQVNRDLTIAVAEKAKQDGVRQFIFLSSIIVYGDSGRINERKTITIDTLPEPANFYGMSKLQAEEGINRLDCDSFRVAVIRPPMIYGPGSKGNFSRLESIARITPIFPDIDNERSMLHVDNLCECIRMLVDNREQGLFFPQDREYVKTSELVRLLAQVNGRTVRLVRLFNPAIRLLGLKVGTVHKMFGNLTYDKSLSLYNDQAYCVTGFPKYNGSVGSRL